MFEPIKREISKDTVSNRMATTIGQINVLKNLLDSDKQFIEAQKNDASLTPWTASIEKSESDQIAAWESDVRVILGFIQSLGY